MKNALLIRKVAFDADLTYFDNDSLPLRRMWLMHQGYIFSWFKNINIINVRLLPSILGHQTFLPGIAPRLFLDLSIRLEDDGNTDLTDRLHQALDCAPPTIFRLQSKLEVHEQILKCLIETLPEDAKIEDIKLVAGDGEVFYES